ncbi:MAG: PrgI family protein [Chloroflexi bacterium]|nr:PrgI family protein [Chloroflexota bacterium]
MQQINFPRRIQLGLRPWYGLTLRQLLYLLFSGGVAGAIVLFGPAQGGGIVIRALIGLFIISIGVLLAFFRKDGMTMEEWLMARIHYVLRPQKRVWTRGGDVPRAEMRVETSHVAGAVLPRTQSSSPAAAAIVLIDMAVILAFFSLVVYFSRGGLDEIRLWFGR